MNIPPVEGICPMAAPTFDESGDYPSDETLQAIRDWPANQINALFDFVLAAWHWSDWASTELRPSEREMVHAEDGEKFLRLATGGWSGNEEIVGALDDNLWARHQWCVSARGGLHIYRFTDATPATSREEASTKGHAATSSASAAQSTNSQSVNTLRAEAQREAFEAGWEAGQENISGLGPERAEAFAAFLTRQAGQK